MYGLWPCAVRAAAERRFTSTLLRARGPGADEATPRWHCDASPVRLAKWGCRSHFFLRGGRIRWCQDLVKKSPGRARAHAVLVCANAADAKRTTQVYGCALRRTAPLVEDVKAVTGLRQHLMREGLAVALELRQVLTAESASCPTGVVTRRLGGATPHKTGRLSDRVH